MGKRIVSYNALFFLLTFSSMNVARLANIPLSVIKVAKQKSDEMQKEMEERQFQNRRIQVLKSIMQPSYDTEQVKHELSML